MLKKVTLTVAMLLTAAQVVQCQLPAATRSHPNILPIRDRVSLVQKITQKRLDTLLPGMMRETGFDMWIITGNEDNHDPIFRTMTPYQKWAPITQILVLFDRGPDLGVERLNISRTNTRGLFTNAWDAGAWDRDKTESQWKCLGRIVRERNPERIGVNEGEIQDLLNAGAERFMRKPFDISDLVENITDVLQMK